MTDIPDKCLNCDHTIIQFENVHHGWCKFLVEPVVRCDCFPAHYKVGCVCANVYCVKGNNDEDDEDRKGD